MASFSPALPDLSGYSLPNQAIDRFSAQNFRFSEAQKPADYLSGKLFEQPIVFIRTVVINQATGAKHPQATGRVICKLPNGFIRALQRMLRYRNRRLGQQTHFSNVGTSAFSSASMPAQRASAASLQPPPLENLRCDPAALPAHQSRTPSAGKSAPMVLRTFSRAAASRCRTDRQPVANRTSTAPKISIPITSSSFLRQKAPQAGIKHASAPALRKHMP